MKKILFLVDALNFNAEKLDFAAYVAKLEKAKLVGVFVEDSELKAAPTVKIIGGQMYVEEITMTAEERRRLTTMREQSLAAFKDGCLQREVDAVVHIDKGNISKNIIHETRYADLIIVDPAFSLTDDKTVPTKFAIDLLSHAECPVLIAPEFFEEPDEIVFAYDGSRSSVFAIKQFYYQLPELAAKKIIVLHVKENSSTKEHHKERNEFREWLEMHYSDISYFELAGDARDELFNYFIENSQRYNKLLVTGAYGRNLLSSFFRPSTAELVLKAVDIPIFVAHH